jgi:Rrf2 family protein
MRMSAKAEYAVRVMIQLATTGSGVVVKTDDLARAQAIPPQFLVDILSALRTDRLVRSRRGREGGYELARPAAEISIADTLRCIDGPLASVHDIGLGDLPYSGATAALTDVWRALRASMRHVLEETSLADVATGALPEHVGTLADDYRDQEHKRGASRYERSGWGVRPCRNRGRANRDDHAGDGTGSGRGDVADPGEDD